MKKLLLLICLVVIVSNYLNAQVTITVNTGAKKQTVRGLGCQDDLESAGGTNDDLLYDLGASSYRAFAVGESAFDEPVNDNADPANLDLTKITGLTGNRLTAYQKAAKRGCVFYMTIGSPPAWMKTNNDIDNGGSLRTDLLTAAYEEFGEFALGATLKFKQQTGVDLYAISVQNEPEFVEQYYSAVYTNQTYLAAAKAIINAYIAHGGITTKLAYGELTFAQNSYIPWAKASHDDPLLTNYVAAMAIHSYDNDPMGGGAGTPLQWAAYYKESIRTSPVKEVWMSEGGTTGNNVDGALGAALQFYNSFKYGQATLFSNRYLGRIGSPANYYGIKNMIRWTRPGAYRYETTCSDTANILCLAFKKDVPAANVLYMVNRSSSDKKVKVNWTGASANFDIFRTSFTENCEWKGQVALTDSITLPAKSISTLVSCSANKLPNIDAVDTVVIIKGSGAKVVNLTGINDGGDGGQTIVMKTWTREGASNLFTSTTVNYTSPNTTGTLTLNPLVTTGNTKVLVSLCDKSLTLDSMWNQKVIGIPVYIIPFKNNAPTMNPIANQSYTKSQMNVVQTLSLGVVGDGNDGSQKLTLSVVVADPSVCTITTLGANTLKITPKWQGGTTQVSVTLKDDGVNVGGGVGSITRTFNVTVEASALPSDNVSNPLVYPVPAHDKINVINKDLKIKSYSIADLTGKTILTGVITDENSEINVSGLIPGVYMISLISDDGIVTNKIIIE